jgi:hypothetical protein
MPLILTDEQKRQVANRLMIQPPGSEHDLADFQRYMREVGRIADFPADVLLTLQVLVDLAEQGNVIAGQVYMRECAELGITFPRRFAL